MEKEIFTAMFSNNMRVYRKTLSILFFAVFLVTAITTIRVYAEEKGLGTINGTVKAKKVKYLKDYPCLYRKCHKFL